ncbi:endonuclease/exonuclease/phosphatase family protein [Streptomyces sp. E2N166]|uniref:endonuclease/exonuclease/phosphatase family protein n=1 Tax=Streptomyces sp. E2N166 TaxID=1851909 RepID=UPI000EF72F76|nr:endonuclease/exonuclease/phosphatase family protein [Streptomyces sp. E2N166]
MPLTAPTLPPGLRRRRGLIALVSVLAVSAVLAAVLVRSATDTARSPAPGRSLTVATWNMCGVPQWGCADTGSAPAKRLAVQRLADAGADVVLLQEACAAHAESVREALGGSWELSFRPYTWRDRDGRGGTIDCAGPGRGTAGLAVLSAHPLSSVRLVPTRQPEVGLRRGVLCATVAAFDVRVCNAHLSLPGSDRAHPEWEYRDDQLRALVAELPGRGTVFGGDFNLNPPGSGNRSGWVWPSAAYGAFRECDQASGTDRSGRATHESGHKLDYLFTGLPRSSCTVRDTGVSDHRALLMRVDVG